jgi:hypothetical protein
MSNMDFFQIGALKVFAELGQLIEEDEKNQVKFLDIPYDIIKIIKNHVTNFKDNEEEYKFLSNFKEGKNKDIYKFFFKKEPHYFKSSLYEYEMLRAENPHIKNYKYEFQLNHINLNNILEYVNNKYQKHYDTITIVIKYRNGIKNKKIDRKYIAIGHGCIVINYNNNNKLQFSEGYKGFSKEYNIPENLKTYLNNNVWNIKKIL